MKHGFWVLVMLVVSYLAIAQTTVYYFVNIDNAPNGSASGVMNVYNMGETTIIASSSLTFIENYYSDHGGKYQSTFKLPQGTAHNPITIKCDAKKPWGTDWLWGHPEQSFTGGSSTLLPTMHIQDPPTPPVDPPDPK